VNPPIYFSLKHGSDQGFEEVEEVAAIVGIRREDMYHWERRTPLVPEDARELADSGIEIIVQSSNKRAFTDEEYRSLGLSVVDSLKEAPVIIGLKEIPVDVFEEGKVYTFFSHTIKGQPANMPMLRRALDLGCTIIDYERIVDDAGRRLIFFGNFAGLAGAIDTLWALGRRLAWEGIENPFTDIAQASTYPNLEAAKGAVRAVGERIEREGLPDEIFPLVIGIAGYGNVSKGAQEILDLLPIEEISAKGLLEGGYRDAGRGRPIVKVVFKEEDTVLRIDRAEPFDLEEYYDRPERYRGAFTRYLPHLHVLLNCIYWEPRYPRLVTRAAIKELYASGRPNLRVIGDISCDVEGGIEVTVKATEPDDPVYVYDPTDGSVRSGVEGEGPVLMAVDILPTELPRESSAYFSGILKGFVPAIASADYTVAFPDLDLPPPLKRAVIAHRGELTPDYRYIGRYLESAADVE